MVCIGSKPLRRKELKSVDSAEMSEGESSYRRCKKNINNGKAHIGQLNSAEDNKEARVKKNKKERSRKHNNNSNKKDESKNSSLTPETQAISNRKSEDPSMQQTKLRIKVDPETAKYFAEIAKLFESNEVELEDRASICANALEETRGKEVELATDMIISHTIQVLLEGSDLEQLCGFLHNCANDFPSIAMDKFGSHVAETALKSLAVHLQDDGSNSMIEDTLNKISKVIVREAVDVMCSQYGSHVLRSLLCLCKGVPLANLEEFHGKKTHAILAERMSSKSRQSGGQDIMNVQNFPVIFNFLVRDMLDQVKDAITSLRMNKYSSFVLQATLKLLVGDDDELLHAVQVILSCDDQGNFIEGVTKQDILALLEDTTSSHLFEVIVEVAPEAIYNKLLNEVFKSSLFELSSHQCGNFVVQALLSSARTRNHVDLFWEELGPRMQELLEIGKSGVVASIVAACGRLQTRVHECFQTLATAVTSGPDSTNLIVPHILFLECYFRQKSKWIWPKGEKMNTLGCLMLQKIFGSKQFIQPYVTSITSMEADHIFEMAKDSGGNHVLEAFLCSEASPKQRYEVIRKLQGHFGELALYPSSSFTVEKCFSACNVPLKESIAAELLTVQAELSKTKHGPYLLKKLDIDGFARQPEHWKRSQKSRESVYKEFQSAFGSQNPSKKKRKHENNESHGILNTAISNLSLDPETPEVTTSISKTEPSGNKQGQKRKSDSTETKSFLSKKFLKKGKSDAPFLNKGGSKRKGETHNRNFVSNTAKDTTFVRDSGKRKSTESELANLAGKARLSSFEVNKLFRANANNVSQSGNGNKPFLKKQRR